MRVLLMPALLAICVGPASGWCNTSVTYPPETTTSVMLSPPQALHSHELETKDEFNRLHAYSDETTIRAELPLTGHKGECRLNRAVSQDSSLSYVGITCTGDPFVKRHIIARLLQADMNRVKEGGTQTTAIVESNYKFTYKGIENIDGRTVYSFVVKPRRKQAWLFKGRVFLDPVSGHLMRATGRLVRTPSWWIKQVDFVQDYSDFGAFTMPIHTQATTRVRILGRVVIEVWHTLCEASSAATD